MLSAEHFQRERAKLSDPPSGLLLPQTAKDLVKLNPQAFVKREERLYKLTRLGKGVGIEGALWPVQGKKARLLETIRDISPMIPIVINENGVIFAGGQRILPLDVRLPLLVDDLINGEKITETAYVANTLIPAAH